MFCSSIFPKSLTVNNLPELSTPVFSVYLNTEQLVNNKETIKQMI